METKDLRQILDDLSIFIKNKVSLIEETAKAYEDLKNSTIYTLKNNDRESEGLSREIARMQQMERVRLLAMTKSLTFKDASSNRYGAFHNYQSQSRDFDQASCMSDVNNSLTETIQNWPEPTTHNKQHTVTRSFDFSKKMNSQSENKIDSALRSIKKTRFTKELASTVGFKTKFSPKKHPSPFGAGQISKHDNGASQQSRFDKMSTEARLRYHDSVLEEYNLSQFDKP